MKLKELYEYMNSQAPTPENYVNALKDHGYYKEPTLKANEGYILVKYHPEFDEAAYSTLGDAKKAAPTQREHHWIIYDAKSGNPVKIPDWESADAYWSWAKRPGY